ncbi:MAG TPA: hypothetical protein VJS63_14890 [Bradyrhizobium sp.]|nr:hypothetical protein [Bradyrhizobium sp.]
MFHLDIAGAPQCPQPLPGDPEKFNLISTLSALYGGLSDSPERGESVDGARPALYKTGNGGGRDPAAAVL